MKLDTNLKHMAILAVLVWVLAFMMGCGTKYANWVKEVNNPPAECEESVIYQTVPLADITSGIVIISLDEFVKMGEGYKSWAISMNTKVIELADNPMTTYVTFATEMTAEAMRLNEWWGSEVVVLVKPVFDAFLKIDKPMNVCDRAFIKSFCQRRIGSLQRQACFLSFCPLG